VDAGLVVCAVVAATALLIGALALLGRWMRMPPYKNPLAGAVARPIAEVGDGEIVKIVGRVELCEETLTAPLTGGACALYETSIEHIGRDAPANWYPVATELRAVELVVADDTGRARIRVGNFDARIVRGHQDTTISLSDERPALTGLIAQYRNRSRRGSHRFTEGVLAAGTQVAVRGLARWEADPDNAAGPRDAARRLVLSSAAPNEALFITNDPAAF
jgi:hypothetical protein